MEYMPPVDPGGELLAMTPSEIRTMASKRGTWLLGLLKAVRSQHVDLRKSKMPPKHFDAMMDVAESYQRQLLLSTQLAPGNPGGLRTAPSAHNGRSIADSLGLGNCGALNPGGVLGAAAPLRQQFAPASAATNPPTSWNDAGFGNAPHQMRMMTAAELPPYPSQGTAQPTLQVSTRLGPTILAHYMATVRDLEQHVRTNMLAWKASSKNVSNHTYYEAPGQLRTRC